MYKYICIYISLSLYIHIYIYIYIYILHTHTRADRWSDNTLRAFGLASEAQRRIAFIEIS